MTKVNIRRLDSVTANDTTATQLINENFTALQTAIENTVSRDGTTPNFMDANLDLNSYKIINAGTPTDNTDVVTKEYFDEYVGDAAGFAEAAENSANRAATSAQVAQGYSTAAAGAADVAQRARDFIESDPGFQTVSEDLLLGEDSEIRKVNANRLNIDTVSQSITNVNAVGNDIVSVSTVAADLTNVDTVASNISDVNTVADDIASVSAVAADLTSIDAVNANKTNIDNVAADLTNINAVAADLSNINNASMYANNAHTWADGTDEQVSYLGGEHSSKGWADIAGTKNQSDWTETGTTSSAYIRNKPTAGVGISFVNNTITVDSDNTPSSGSTKPVQSGGVYTVCNNLQTQIDAITSASDVYDIVGTYAELQAYNISIVPVNDIIKVLVDETHSGAATYYRCTESGGVKSWTYVGSEGAYYTKGEADSTFSTIAATGYSLEYTNPTLSLKNASGTVLNSVTVKSTPDTDNVSISLNSAQELQAIGTVNKNTATGATNPVYDWVGTLQEYIDQNVAVAHPTWICYITDDVQGGITVYTKNQVNNLLSVKANSADVYTKTETNSALALKANIANFQVVSALPAEPTAGVFYFVVES